MLIENLHIEILMHIFINVLLEIQSSVLERMGWGWGEVTSYRQVWSLDGHAYALMMRGASQGCLPLAGVPWSSFQGAWLAVVHGVAEDSDTTWKPDDNNIMTNSLIQSLRVIGIIGNGLIQSSNPLVFLKTSILLLKIVCFPVTLVSCLRSLHTRFYIKTIRT